MEAIYSDLLLNYEGYFSFGLVRGVKIDDDIIFFDIISDMSNTRTYEWACQYNHREIINHLSFVHDNMLLSIAARHGHLNILKYLIDHGGDIHHNGDEPFRWAANNGQLDMIRYLLEYCSPDREALHTGFRHGVINGHLNIVRQLISHGVDIYYGEYQPIYWYEDSSNFDTLSYLYIRAGRLHEDFVDVLLWHEYIRR